MQAQDHQTDLCNKINMYSSIIIKSYIKFFFFLKEIVIEIQYL